MCAYHSIVVIAGGVGQSARGGRSPSVLLVSAGAFC